uniref:Uncharacterized protein n=1 Tax=Vespula pensylvanica TaxID=30213 RepID=A0A834JS20_VESPE|nr:hypothetical protein H0235_017381 [Vespula pensylvanica]
MFQHHLLEPSSSLEDGVFSNLHRISTVRCRLTFFNKYTEDRKDGRKYSRENGEEEDGEGEEEERGEEEEEEEEEEEAGRRERVGGSRELAEVTESSFLEIGIGETSHQSPRQISMLYQRDGIRERAEAIGLMLIFNELSLVFRGIPIIYAPRNQLSTLSR